MELSTGDLFSGLSILVLVLVIGGLIAAFSIARARRHGSTTLALDVTRNASYGWVMLMGLGAIVSGFMNLGTSAVALDDSIYPWVRDQERSLASSACIDGDVSDGAMLCGPVVGPVPFGPRIVLYAGTLLTLLASAAIAWAIHHATRRAGERAPFHRSVWRTFTVVAVVVMVAAVVGGLLQQIGMTLAAQSLNWGSDASPIPFRLQLPLWPFAVAVGLFALSAIFRYGAQLQRETEGLV
ncbi:hypothetical protein ACFWHT_11915 [Microbacterium sp. NPDC058342]|uniref:hypothetical protein n=1 Tax=Microbacterium sp. NPDC058342 TaxID=3346454 RepID=UPI003661D2A7